MACEYCKNKSKNRPLVESKNKDEGVIAWVQKSARDGGTYLCAYGWYDGIVGTEPQQVRINYCPMCGEKAVEE